MRTLTFTVLLAFAVGAQAPPDAQVAATQKQAMAKLGFLTGKWKGQGWIATGPGEPHRFTQTEDVQSKLGGTLVLIEGLGNEEGATRVVHQALAVVSYDDAKTSYRFHAYSWPGRYVESEAEVTEKSLQWGSVSGPANVRFRIVVNEKGQWHETGETSMDGKTWRQFFEMLLDRQP